MLWEVTGWVLWGLMAGYVASSLGTIYLAAQARQSVMYLRLYQVGVFLPLAVLFLVFDWDKNHLAWVVPLSWVVFLTPIGRAYGSAIGYITQFLFPAR